MSPSVFLFQLTIVKLVTPCLRSKRIKAVYMWAHYTCLGSLFDWDVAILVPHFLDLRSLKHDSVLALDLLMGNCLLNRKAIAIDFVELLHNLLSLQGLLRRKEPLLLVMILTVIRITRKAEKLVCLLLNSKLFVHPLSLLFSASSFLLIRAGAIVATRTVFLFALLLFRLLLLNHDLLLTCHFRSN